MSRRMLILVATVSYSGWYFSREIWPGSSEAAHDTGHLLSFIQHSCWPPPPAKTSSTPPPPYYSRFTTCLSNARGHNVWNLILKITYLCFPWLLPIKYFRPQKLGDKGQPTTKANSNLWMLSSLCYCIYMTMVMVQTVSFSICRNFRISFLSEQFKRLMFEWLTGWHGAESVETGW